MPSTSPSESNSETEVQLPPPPPQPSNTTATVPDTPPQPSNTTASVPDNILGRAGGAYIPPAKLRQLQAQITDKNSQEYQKISWEALRKSINGLINKVNVANIKNIVPELFSENLIRGKGLLCKSIMKSQAASLPFTHVYAALVSVINTKFPQIGDLLLTRLIIQFKKSFKRNDKSTCLATTKFIAHLVNQRVASEIVALQILTLLLERPTDDSTEIAVGFTREVGAFLMDASSKAMNAIFERFRSILHEGEIDKRTQYMVEVLFIVRRDNFKDNVTIIPELDLVEEEDQITHDVRLDDDDLTSQEMLNIFKFDAEFVTHENEYLEIKKEILGDESDDSSSSSDGDDEADSDEEDQEENEAAKSAQAKLQIVDETNTNLINLRRAIYLTIMSSLNFEECAHKLLKLSIEEQHEIELCNMIIECCSQERTYVNFYGLLGERFCKISPAWSEKFSTCFEETFKTIHRYETNRLRNIGKYFAHLLASNGITWQVFALIRLTEQDTTSSSRIFIKILFMELVESLGLVKLGEKLKDPEMVINFGGETIGVFDGLFPKDNPRNTRFAINYFTSIGMGALTEDLREHLKNAPKMIMAQQRVVESSDSDSSSSSDSDSSSSSDSDSSSSSSDSSSSSSSSSSSDSSSSESVKSDAERRRRSRGVDDAKLSKRRYEVEKERRASRDEEEDIHRKRRRESPRRTSNDDDRRRRSPRRFRDHGRRSDRRSSPPRSRRDDDRNGERNRRPVSPTSPRRSRRMSPSPKRNTSPSAKNDERKRPSPSPSPSPKRVRRSSPSPKRSPPPNKERSGRRASPSPSPRRRRSISSPKRLTKERSRRSSPSSRRRRVSPNERGSRGSTSRDRRRSPARGSARSPRRRKDASSSSSSSSSGSDSD